MSGLFDILAPITIILFIGYLIGRSQPNLQTRTVSDLVVYVGTPALIFSTLVEFEVSAETFWRMALAATSCVLVAGILGLLVLARYRKFWPSFLPSLMFPNSGNLGIPIVLLAFGQEGLKLAISYFVPIALAQHSIGLSISAGSVKIGHLVRQPILYAIILSIITLSYDLYIPEILMITTEILGGLMIPAMLLLLGISLANLSVTDFKPAVLLAFGRLFIGLISAVIVVFLLGLDRIYASVVLVMATMPIAIVCHVYSERYDRNESQVAGGILVSTAGAFFVLPVILWISSHIESSGPPSLGWR